MFFKMYLRENIFGKKVNRNFVLVVKGLIGLLENHS